MFCEHNRVTVYSTDVVFRSRSGKSSPIRNRSVVRETTEMETFGMCPFGLPIKTCTGRRIPWRLRTSETWLLVSSPKSHYGKLYAPVATVALRRQPADGGPVVWPLGNKSRYLPRRPLHRIPARFGDKNKKKKKETVQFPSPALAPPPPPPPPVLPRRSGAGPECGILLIMDVFGRIPGTRVPTCVRERNNVRKTSNYADATEKADGEMGNNGHN